MEILDSGNRREFESGAVRDIAEVKGRCDLLPLDIIGSMIDECNERLCNKAQWEIRELVREMVKLVDPELQFMLVPKCQSGRIICNSPCKGN